MSKLKVPDHRQDLFRAAYREHMRATGNSPSSITQIAKYYLVHPVDGLRTSKLWSSEVQKWIDGATNLGAEKLHTLAHIVIGKDPHRIDPEWEDPFEVKETLLVGEDDRGRTTLTAHLVAKTEHQQFAVDVLAAAFDHIR